MELIPILISIPILGFWFWMLSDLSNNEYISKQEKTNWFLIIVLLNVFGAAWYYLVEYRNRNL